ncbi:MAG: response regulator transcription factor [Defluviitaleaceae bacterium]|nr:response regulator transcription factor [Defluviitaleaceae bacterium]
MRNILLVEDEADIQFANKIFLERRGGYNVRLAMSLAEARQSIAELLPDLIVLDIMLPDGNGLDFLKELRQGMNINMLVLLLTALSETSDELKGLAAGGDDYITKPYDNRLLLARIERMLHRAAQIPDILAIGTVKMDMPSKRSYVNDKDMNLTSKEFSLLEQFVQHPETVMSAEHLYVKVWGQEMIGDYATLKKTISKLRTKLSELDAEYTIIAQKGRGYYLEKT